MQRICINKTVRRVWSGLTLVGLSVLAVPAVVSGESQAAQPGLLPATDPLIAAKVETLLAQMTLEEKVAQLSMRCFGDGKDIAEFDGQGLSSQQIFDKQAEKMARDFQTTGIGSIARLPFDLDVRQGVEVFNRLQRQAKEATRLGIPLLITNAGLHGLAVKGATSYPQSIAMAATFNPELVEEVAVAIGEETRSRGVRMLLTPVLDLGREPRHGRVEETYGEDRLLVSRLGVAFIRGVQSTGVICTPKHFVANYVGDGGREGVNVSISERELRELHLLPYEAAVREAGALGVMAAYNAINGIPCSTNRWLLTDVLRGEWGFQGVVVSDASSIPHAWGNHHQTATKGEAARLCLEAGMDIDLPRPNTYYKELPIEAKAGRLKQEVLDESVRRILRLKYRLGLFENPYTDLSTAEKTADAPEQRQLALKAARQSVVLLKNDAAVLPVRATVKKIAVIGPNADKLSLGGYSSKVVQGDTPLGALKKKLGHQVAVAYARGCNLNDGDTGGIPEAVKIAKESDLCVLFMGGAYGVTGGESQERATLELMGQQELLIEKIAETGKPVVVVLVDGRPVVMNRWADKVAAVMMAWYGGEEGGTAIAEIIKGECNPSGKLPITFPLFTGQAPLTYDHLPYGREGGYAEIPDPERTRYLPRYPFGFGLSYTTFTYANLKCSPTTNPADGTAEVSVELTNSGSVAGEEVVQAYLSHGTCRITQPVQRLIGFKRIHLQPGEMKTVTFTIQRGDRSFLNEQMKPEVNYGKFSVRVGGNCLAGLTGSFAVDSSGAAH